MLKSRPSRWFVVTLAVLLAIPVGYYFFIIDWQGRPFCHEVVDSVIQQWMLEANTKSYPNAGGKSHESLFVIGNHLKNMEWAENYNYVPGLQEGDPPELVLMYVNRPTRWNWHGQVPTIFKDKAWIVVPIIAGQSRPGVQIGEASERVSFEDFRARLTGTLDFLRTNQRPSWQTVVAEHGKFLQSLDRKP